MVAIGETLLGLTFLVVLGCAAVAAGVWSMGQVKRWRLGCKVDKWELSVAIVCAVVAVLAFAGMVFIMAGYDGSASGVVVEKQTKWLPNPALKNIPTIHYQLVLREDDGDYKTVDVSEDAYNHMSLGDWYEKN